MEWIMFQFLGPSRVPNLQGRAPVSRSKHGRFQIWPRRLRASLPPTNTKPPMTWPLMNRKGQFIYQEAIGLENIKDL